VSRHIGTIEEIRARLFDMSDAQFAELVEFIDRARASAAGRDFSAAALAAMRPRLRVARPRRRRCHRWSSRFPMAWIWAG